MSSIRELEIKAQKLMERREYIKAFDFYEVAIKTIDEGLGNVSDNYKKQVFHYRSKA